MDSAARRARNRAADPEFAGWLDDMRSRFGATLTRVEWPDGRTWGAKPERARLQPAQIRMISERVAIMRKMV